MSESGEALTGCVGAAGHRVDGDDAAESGDEGLFGWPPGVNGGVWVDGPVGAGCSIKSSVGHEAHAVKEWVLLWDEVPWAVMELSYTTRMTSVS